MAEPPEPNDPLVDLPPHLKRLKLLVTVLTVTMILGVITITGVLVIRLSEDRAPVLVHPDKFVLPEGVLPLGYSVVGDQAVIVGDDGVIRAFDLETGEVRQAFTLD